MSEDEQFGDRLKLILDELGMKGNAFADSISVSGGRLHGILNNNNSPSVKFCYSIFETYPQVNLDHLITGRGTPFLKEGEKLTKYTLIKEKEPPPGHKIDYKKEYEGCIEKNKLLEEMLSLYRERKS